jgi:hypothetical protein
MGARRCRVEGAWTGYIHAMKRLGLIAVLAGCGPAARPAEPVASAIAPGERECVTDADCVLGRPDCSPCGLCPGPATAFNRLWLEAESASCDRWWNREDDGEAPSPLPACSPCPQPEGDPMKWPTVAVCENGACVAQWRDVDSPLPDQRWPAGNVPTRVRRQPVCAGAEPLSDFRRPESVAGTSEARSAERTSCRCGR